MSHTPLHLNHPETTELQKQIYHILGAGGTQFYKTCRLAEEIEAGRLAGSSTPDLLAERDALRAALEETLQQLCDCCRRLNPQHANCVWCQDTEQARARRPGRGGGGGMKTETICLGSKFPAWAKLRTGWKFVGWISRKPVFDLSFWQLCQSSLRSDHGEQRRVDYYPEGAVCWMREKA